MKDGLPQHWKIGNLGDESIARTASGGTPDRSKPEYFGGDIRWVKSGELDDNQLFDTEEKLTPLGLENSSAKMFAEGTLLVAMYGATAGKTAILGVPATTNQAICAILPNGESFDSQFLQFQLIHIRPKLLSARSGGAQPNISQTVLKTLDVTLAPLPEQRAIAHVLRAVQAARETRQREVSLERERKAALMVHLFTHGTRGESTKQTPIGEMPVSWKVSTIGECAILVNSGSTPRGGQKSYLESGVPLIRSQNVLMSRLDMSDVAYISQRTHKDMERSETCSGDILLNITGASIGRVTHVPESVPVANVNQHVCRIRLQVGKVGPAYLAGYLTTPEAQSRIMGAQSGTTRQGLTFGQIRRLQFPLPSLDEQQLIAEALTACDVKIAALERESALLEELMTGRVAVAGMDATDGNG